MKHKNFTKEQEKISKAHLGIKTKGSTGMHWYNNGLKNVLCLESDVPDGFVKGRLNNLLISQYRDNQSDNDKAD